MLNKKSYQKMHSEVNNKHSKDDISLEKQKTFKNSNRRFTTEQAGKISNQKHSSKKKIKNNFLQSALGKISKQKMEQSHGIKSKYSSCKNLKEKLDIHIPENYLRFFSPKGKKIASSSTTHKVLTKPTLKQKKISKNQIKTNLKGNHNKSYQQQKITPFQIKPFQNKQKHVLINKGNNEKKCEKIKIPKVPYSIKRGKRKQKVFKTLQNQTLNTKNKKDSGKVDLSKKANTSINIHKKNGLSKSGTIDNSNLYHKQKMKTQHSYISCESTPSQFLTDQLQLIDIIGQGTFGKVYKAIIKKTGQTVAIKKVFQDKKYKNRQIEIVSLLDSPFIMKVLGTYITYEGKDKQYLNIVMNYYQTDLFVYLSQFSVNQLEQNQDIVHCQINPLNTKLILYQMFRSLMYIHSKDICHRDVKPHNILINPQNKSLALCDFGSAKILKPHQKNLPYICSRCYRAPQLIFGSTQYTTMIDIWSVGCVILEMLNKKPLFIGNSSIDHLIEVIKVLGTPTKTQVKEMNPNYDLKDYKFPNIKQKPFKKLFPSTDPLLLSLLQQIMIYSPKQRLNAAQALVHEYFDELRQEETYKKLQQQNDGLADLFDFKSDQLRENQHLYAQLTPKWYKSLEPFSLLKEQIQKNNFYKFYCD